MSYAIVRTDNLDGTKLPSALVSVKYYVVDGQTSTATAIENGNVVKLDGLMTGEREAYKGLVPARDTALKDVVLVASSELMYDERKKNFDEFINEAGEISRGYRFITGNTFSITAEAYTAAATVVVGDIVELAASTKFKVVAKATGLTSGSTQVGTIIAIETVGTKKFYVIKVA